MSNIRAVSEETIGDNNMTALAKAEEIKKQVETFETFLRSNPFLKVPDAGPGMIPENMDDNDDMDNGNEIFAVHFEHNEKLVQFFTNRNDGNIKGWLATENGPENTVSFAPTDTEAVIKFLNECGYFNGHEAMTAMVEATKSK